MAAKKDDEQGSAHHGRQVLLGVRGLGPELLFQALVCLGAAREGGQLATADVAEEVDEPEQVRTLAAP
ncbi:hypothetical protein CLM82_29540, partial [Streptomyces albidoflavus]